MRAARSRFRAGITLTEILIAILIMGVGMTSVATLFPLGILRIREATRDSRSTLLAESAISEVNSRDLLNARTFSSGSLFWQYAPGGPLYPSNFPVNYFIPQLRGLPFDPSVKDLNRPQSENIQAPDPNSAGVIAYSPTVFGTFQAQPGLPICYDPLFWATVHYGSALDSSTPFGSQTHPLSIEARFGSGIGFLRPDPDGERPSATGLQRLTNFAPYDPTVAWPLTYSMPSTPPAALSLAEVAGDVFTSIDDIEFQPEGNDGNAGQASSPLVPYNFALNGFSYDRKYEFSWMITARQAAAGESSVYEADIVVFHNRPLGLTTAYGPFAGGSGGPVVVPDGDRVVEAVWGHTGATSAIVNGYSTADDYTVLLRWHTATPEPTIKVGNWIADVTYERVQRLSNSRFNVSYPGQRCHWYRIAQVSRAEPDPVIPNHRRMVIRVETPLKAKTRIVNNGSGQVVPVHVEAALLNNYIVNVFPTLLYSR